MDWLRLWHDMPNDPKWRAIARRSGQRISDVIAVYLHMMVNASENDTRGTLSGWDDEDVGAALDLDTEAVEAIRHAMQGKVLDGDNLAGWEKRQPKKNDDSRERVRRHREKKAEESKKSSGSSNDEKRSAKPSNDDVTPCNAPDTDTDTDTELKNKNTGSPDGEPVLKKFSESDFEDFWTACRTNWFGKPGHKHEARSEFLKLKPAEHDLAEIKRLTILECHSRKRLQEQEGFAESMKHVCRWIKVRGWQDVEDRPRRSTSQLDEMKKAIGDYI